MKVCQSCGVVLEHKESDVADHCPSCIGSSDIQSVRNSILDFWNSRAIAEKSNTGS